MTRSRLAVLVAGAGVLAAACSSSSSDSSSAESSPSSASSSSASSSSAGSSSAQGPASSELCASTRALQSSITDLGDVQVVEQGSTALESAVSAVQSALGDVADDASSAFSSQVAGLQADVDALLAAARTAIADPSSAAVSGVRTAAGELADDVSAFAQDVASTC